MVECFCSTNNHEYNRSGVDLSKDNFEIAVSYDQGPSAYDLQRQNNIYDSLGHLFLGVSSD